MMEIAGFSTFLLHIMFMDRRALFVGCYWKKAFLLINKR
jgi:hypothetical protein